MATLKVFTKEQFETLEKVIEVLIVTNGPPAISAFDAAISLDEMLAEANSPALDTIPKVFDQLENIVPKLFGEFHRFSNLSKAKRRKVLNKVIDNDGLLMEEFRDLAIALKVMSCISYYGSENGSKQVGFIAVDNRSRFDTLEQSPIIHLDIN